MSSPSDGIHVSLTFFAYLWGALSGAMLTAGVTLTVFIGSDWPLLIIAAVCMMVAGAGASWCDLR